MNLIVPALCIAAARMIVDLTNRLRMKFRQLITLAIILGIVVGLLNTVSLISMDVNAPYIQAALLFINI